MKPWLFDILACPIDKHFPLNLYIFSFETETEEFIKLLKIYRNKELETIKNDKIIEISYKNDELYLKDNVIIKKTPMKTYLELIISSIDEFNNIFDKTANEISKNCFQIAKSQIKSKLSGFYDKIDPNLIEDILPELYFLNKLKIETEIESGLLYCNKCNRWYPIIDTIPHMLPDEYRDEEKEIEFLKNNKNLLDDEFFNQDLKPFNPN
ncbi:MAG: Trm112 family protein [Promethearchaeota archaeon]